jgi:hypothetical protein
MKPNRAQAEKFITALTGSVETPVTWQVFPDLKGSREPAPEYFHGKLDVFWAKLVSLNERGANISVMVNAGDGAGRCAKSVVSARALFVDDDDGRINLATPLMATMRPSIIVRSKRGPHVYWPLKEGEQLSLFTTAQKALAAYFGTDAAVSDWPRVMRVPGFLHQKDPSNPFLVHLLEAAPERRFTISEVLRAFPAPAPKTLPFAPRGFRPPFKSSKKSRRQALAVLEEFENLEVIRWAFENPEDVGYEAWRGIATNIATAVVDEPELHEQGERLFHELSAADSARYLPVETTGVFREALKSAVTHGPMRYDTLIAAGVPEEFCKGAELAAAPVAVARVLSEAPAAELEGE